MYRLLFGVILFGCGEEVTDDTDTNTETITDTNTDDETGTQTQTDPPASIAMEGIVAYDDGTKPKGAVRVQMCSAEGCTPAFPDESGLFNFPGLYPGVYNFDVVPTIGEHPDRQYATPLSVLEVVEDQEPIALEETVIIYEYDHVEEPMEDGDFDAGGGLMISVDSESFEPAFQDLEADFMAGIHVDHAEAGLPIEGLAGDIVGVWYLGPFQGTVDNWTFRVEGLGLTEGTELTAYNVDYEGISWIGLGTVTVDASGVAHSDSGVGIQHLTTFVLTQ